MPKYGIQEKHLSGWYMLDIMNKRQAVAVLVLLGVVVFFGGVKYYEMRLHKVKIETEVTVAETVEQEPQETVIKLVTVHVVGAVETPGVYSLEEGKRIDDAVRLAVPTDKADLTQINLAVLLEDGKQIYVPSEGEKLPAAIPDYRVGMKESGLININTASSAKLEELPGIGPALAGRIIAYRESNGPFKAVSEITRVSGIGPVLLEKIKNKITVE